MRLIVLISLLSTAAATACFSQGAQTYFNTSANHYVQNRRGDALASVQAGLQKYPNDQKLKALSERLKEEKKKEDQKRNEENKEKEQQEQQKKEQQKKEQQEK